MAKQKFALDFAGRELIVETGELAKQANGSVLIRYEDTVVLTAATASKQPKDLDFFPLTVAFEEKLYSVGKIPGGFLRREGRPSEHATLTSRLIDRTLRPLFPEGFRNEVQVINMILSVDNDNSPEMSAMFGSSLALGISDIPFSGPIAGVTVGRVNGEYIINPTIEELEHSDIDLVVSGTKNAINMVEAGAKEVEEADMLEAMLFGHEFIKQLCVFQEEIIAAIGIEKQEVVLYQVDDQLETAVLSKYQKQLQAAVAINDRILRYDTIDAIEAEALEHFDVELSDVADKEKSLKQVKEVLKKIVSDEIRRLITVDKVRPDGRRVDELRNLDSQIDLLNRVHGSAMFTRGETQVMSICTLGAMGDNQIIDDLTLVEFKRFMHHYNFPLFSVGETGRIGPVSRREVGHGALGERALSYVLPTQEEFPYAIRLVAEVLESNGSSSQASVCAGSMALMAAGVPIKAAVAGIAMGLVTYDDKYQVLTDIQGIEDHFGDMDFKVAGTAKGITALQMDIKIEGLTKEILEEALTQAKVGRDQILDNMNAIISESRPEVAKYAPKIAQMQVPIDKIRDIIGPGGKIINQIIAESDDVKIDIEDDGRVVIYHQDIESINKAKSRIELIIKTAEVGEIYDAKVVRIEKFGAFVQLFEGTDGLLHVSKIAHERVEKVEDVLAIGDIVKVKVIDIDDKGRVNVSRKDLLERPKRKPRERQKRKHEQKQ
ncbi:MAG: polyribonucleotide nucleotidyltransferase [Erysipelothrix sp.]|jgi:polyribonucleotide nucleotidyltransferase|nr:polyribonucleotide nucleotidyltransferase [Erysipelothrix sp.]